MVGVAAGIFYQRRTYKIQAAKLLKQRALDIEKDLIVRREFLVALPKDKVVSEIEKQLSPDWVLNPGSSESVASFRLNEIGEMKKSNPKLYKKLLSSRDAGKIPEFEGIISQYVLSYNRWLRSTTPSEVIVRVVGENHGESRCIAECRPHLYTRLIVPQYGTVQGDLDLQAQVAKNECRTVLEDVIVRVGG